MIHDERYRKLYDATEVNQRIGALATEILYDHGSTDPLFVALLRGAAPFSSKLMYEMTKQAPLMHPELDYMTIGVYGEDKRGGEPRIVTDVAPTTTVYGRDIIVIDDVLDVGRTADFVKSHLERLGALSIKLAVLARKGVDRQYPIDADYVGFDTGDAWLVGMGMDNQAAGIEAYRWLDEIWEIKKDEPQMQHAMLLDPAPDDEPSRV